MLTPRQESKGWKLPRDTLLAKPCAAIMGNGQCAHRAGMLTSLQEVATSLRPERLIMRA